jgi:hypothetical protein
MKLTDFLKQDSINVYDNGNPYANLIKESIKEAEQEEFNFDKNIEELTDDEIYYIFRPLILYFNKPRPFFPEQIVEIMKNEFSKELNK